MSHDARHEPRSSAALGRKPSAQQQQLARASLADLADHERQHDGWNEAQPHFGEAELGVVRADGQIARRHQPASAADGRSVDTRDDRTAVRADRLKQIRERPAVVQVFLGRRRLHGLERRQIRACRERRSGAGQHDHAHVVSGCIQGAVERVDQVAAEGVALVGAVHRQAQDGSGLFYLEQGVGHDERYGRRRTTRASKSKRRRNTSRSTPERARPWQPRNDAPCYRLHHLYRTRPGDPLQTSPRLSRVASFRILRRLTERTRLSPFLQPIAR